MAFILRYFNAAASFFFSSGLLKRAVLYRQGLWRSYFISLYPLPPLTLFLAFFFFFCAPKDFVPVSENRSSDLLHFPILGSWNIAHPFLSKYFLPCAQSTAGIIHLNSIAEFFCSELIWIRNSLLFLLQLKILIFITTVLGTPVAGNGVSHVERTYVLRTRGGVFYFYRGVGL